MVKKIIIGVVILLVIVVVWLGVKILILDKNKNQQEQQTGELDELPPLEVRGAIADSGDVVKWVECLGRIEAQRKVDFISPTNTYIQRIYVEEGDRVKSGQRLAQLRYGAELAQYEQALFDLEKARSRYQYSLEQGDTNQDLLRVSSGLLSAEREYTAVSRTIQDLNITAPFDGVIANVNLAQGSSVRQGDVVLSVYSDQGLVVEADVPQTEVRGITVGNHARVRSVDQDREEQGTVTGISPVVDQNGTGKVLISVNDHWLIGEIVEVHIESEKYQNRIRVPLQAVLQREGRFLVFLVKEGKAKWQWIEVGETGRDYVEVVEGVIPGDTVLVEGQFTIAHDALVKVVFE